MAVMRFLTQDKNKNLYFVENPRGPDGKIAPYTILSHTWIKVKGRNKKGHEVEVPLEVNFEDMQGSELKLEERKGYKEASYEKIKFAVERACKDTYQYCWVDTCCINKADSIETAASIRSMFEWYKRSEKCYVYLADVTDMTLCDPERSEFRRSKWFKRGWTLQELLAPVCVEFYSKNGNLLGTKQELKDLIHDITKIPTDAICGITPLRNFSVSQKLHWRTGRETTNPEDEAYCLLGIFEVDIDILHEKKHDIEILHEEKHDIEILHEEKHDIEILHEEKHDIEILHEKKHTAFAQLLDAIFRKHEG